MIPNSFEDNLMGWFLRRTSSSAVRRVADLPMAIASSVGLVREENQDRVAVFRFGEPTSGREYLLVALCDGMGGMEDGAACAAQALACFSNAVIESAPRMQPERCLFEAAMYANRRVYEAYRGTGGATLSAMLIMSDRNENYRVNVGDSRIYRFDDKSFRQLTVDDTLAGQLAREPDTYLGRNELLQFVGVGPIAEPHVSRDDNRTADSTYLITSDGVHFLPPKMLNELNIYAPEPAIAARRLIDLAMWCGGHDNASLAIGTFSRDVFKTLPPIQAETLEVWDAFGEARFFGAAPLVHRSFHPPPMEPPEHVNFIETAESKTRKSEELLKKSEPEVGRDFSGNEKEMDGGSNKLSTKRKRATKKKAGAGESQREKPDEQLPQLTINFRRKDGAK
jgi:serine/threonine protein phosphatase PrpC